MQKSKILCNGWSIFLFAFLLRLIVVFLTNSHISPEVWEYETMATNFLDGRGFVYRDFGTLYHFSNELLYPAVCAAVYLLTNHSYFVIEIVQAAASAGVAALVYNISGRRFRLNNIGAFLAAILVAVHPGILVYTVKLHPFVFDMLLMSMTFVGFLVLLENLSARNILLSGFLTGLCFLTKPVISVFALAALGYAFSVHRPGIKKVILFFAAWFFCASLVVSPLAIRNYIIYKTFLVTRSTSYYPFWIGNNPYSSGSAVDGYGRAIYDVAGEGFKKKIESNLNELEQNRLLRNEVLTFIKSDPTGFVLRTIVKFFYFWWFTPQAGLFYPEWQFFLYKAWYLAIILTAMCGFAMMLRQGSSDAKRGAILALIYFLSVSLVQSLCYVEGRHRLVIEPVLLIFTAYTITVWSRKGKTTQCAE